MYYLTFHGDHTTVQIKVEKNKNKIYECQNWLKFSKMCVNIYNNKTQYCPNLNAYVNMNKIVVPNNKNLIIEKIGEYILNFENVIKCVIFQTLHKVTM